MELKKYSEVKKNTRNLKKRQYESLVSVYNV